MKTHFLWSILIIFLEITLATTRQEVEEDQQAYRHLIVRRETESSPVNTTEVTKDFEAMYYAEKKKAEEAKKEADQKIANAKKEAKKEADQKIANAKKEADQKMANATKEAEKAKKEAEEERKLRYMETCGREQRLAVKYIEHLILKASQTPNLKDFQAIIVNVKNREFDLSAKGNPTVSLNATFSKKLNDLTTDELTEYKQIYSGQPLTQREKWAIACKWLAHSDEYKLMVNGDKVKRLEQLSSTIRNSSDTDPEITVELIEACFLENWKRLSDIMTKGSLNSPVTFKLLEDFIAMGESCPSMAKTCTFRLREILDSFPLSSKEYREWDTWVNENKFQLESWELDPKRNVPGKRRNSTSF